MTSWLTIGLSLLASWGQAGLQGVAVIYGLAQVYQVSPYYMVQPVSGCHHSISSGLGVGVTIIYGQARILVSP